MLERGLEHTLVFVLWDPWWAFGESMPESLGESSFRALYGHLELLSAAAMLLFLLLFVVVDVVVEPGAPLLKSSPSSPEEDESWW